MKKILVTGGSGFIGTQVVKELLKKGYDVHLTSISAPSKNDSLSLHQVDLMSLPQVSELFEKHQFDSLLHLAWYTGDKCHSSNINIDWTIASLHLLKCFIEQGGKKFLGAGSVSEYDFSYGYLREDVTPLDSNAIYAQCKASLYKTGNIYCKQNGVDFQWARIFNLYGPDEKTSRLMPSVIRSALKGEDIKVSDCLKIQDYLHVYDSAKGIVNLFESNVHGAVNICSGLPVRLRTIVEKIAQLTEFKGKILWGSIPSNFDDPFVAGSNERLKKEVGWSQQIDLDEGLKMTIDWWRRNQNV